MAKMKKKIEKVSGRVFDKTRLEISMKMCDGTRLWFVAKSKEQFLAIYEFLKIEEELEDEYYRKYH